MKRLLLVLMAVFLLGCSAPNTETADTNAGTPIPNTPTPTRRRIRLPTVTPEPTIALTPTLVPLPDNLKSRINDFIEKAALVNASTRQGVNYVNYSDYMAELAASYDLMNTLWPDDLEPEAHTKLAKALQGWELALSMWELKINDEDNPMEPDVNGYEAFIDYDVDGRLMRETYPITYKVVKYRTKDYLPIDENISILFTIASEYYEEALVQILPHLD